MHVPAVPHDRRRKCQPALREIYAPPDATDHPYYQLATADLGTPVAAEEIWVAHLAQ